MGNNLAFSLFVPRQGIPLFAAILVALAVGIAFLFMLMAIPPRYRKYVVMGVTFLAGWFYLLEFFIPGSSDTGFARRQFLDAQRHLQYAQQTVAGLERDKNVPASEVAQRTAIARTEMDSALKDLQAGKTSLTSLLPKLEKQSDLATGRAVDFAKRHRLTNKMLGRKKDTDKIEDQDIIIISQRIGETTKAVGQATTTIEAIKEAQKQSSLAGLSSAIGEAADSAGLAAGRVSSNSLTGYKDVVGNVSQVIGAFTLLLGITNLLMIHFKTIAGGRLGWPSSIAFFIAFFAILLFGLMKTYGGKSAVGAAGTAWYNMLFFGALSQLSSSMFALVAFYIVSAAYRAFRVRSAEAGLMMAAAFLVMLGFVPFGIWLTSGIPQAWHVGPHTSISLSFLHLDLIKSWIMQIPNAAAQRGMAFGIGVGALAMALRIWLSLERGSYFDKQM